MRRTVGGHPAVWRAPNAARAFVPILVLLSLSAPACGRANGVNVADQTPVVRVTLGEALTDVARRSTYDLSAQLRSGSAIDLVTVTHPVVLEYEGAGRAVALPAGRFLSMDIDAGGVVGIAASPHLDALSLDSALTLGRQVGGMLERHGWTAVPGDDGSRAVESAARTDTTGFVRADLGRWRAAGDEVTIRIRQVESRGAGPDSRRYVLSVEFDNPRVAEARARQIRGERAQTPAT